MAVATRRRSGLVLPVLVAAAAAVLLLVAATGAEARPLGVGGDGWAAAGAGPLPGGGMFIVETLRRLYLQQLGGPGASC